LGSFLRVVRKRRSADGFQKIAFGLAESLKLCTNLASFRLQIWPGTAMEAIRDARGEGGLKILVRNQTRETVLANSVEVADTSAKRRTGLLKRERLEAGEGLWIVPCESVHTFFMKFPIDLVYLSRQNRVRKVRSAVPPWRMSACLLAHSVLELRAGTIEATGTAVGDELVIEKLDQ
jgi:uncharacterized protein